MATILVVNDEPRLVEVVRFRLGRDHVVLSAADGPAGLMAAFSRVPDLILLDATLPGGDSFAVLQSLKNDARTAQTPIILLTGPAGPAALAPSSSISSELPVDNWLAKPFDADELARIIGDALAFGGKLSA